MYYYTYLLKSISPGVNKTYVGYTVDIKNRLKKHNSNCGAKSTRGYKWILLYKKKFKTKSEAMSFEFKLKNSNKMRKEIVNKFT